jgi:hypothetical protein
MLAVFELVFLFTGLCGFVPDVAAQRLDVVLVDGKAANGTLNHKKHVAMLIVHKDRVASGPLVFKELCDDFRGYVLEDDVVTVVGASGPVILEVPAMTDEECPISAPEMDGYGWAFPMGQIHLGNGRIGSALLSTTSSSNTSFLNLFEARLELTGGTASTRHLSRTEDGIAKWQYLRDNGTVHQRAMADLVEFRQNVSGSSV